MTVNYKGTDKEFAYRVAEIGFEEREQKLYSKIEQMMNIKGWKLNQVTDGYALCEVENKEEYKDFAKDYKEVKKSAKLQLKFGI